MLYKIMFVMNCKYKDLDWLLYIYVSYTYMYMISLVFRLSPHANKPSDGKLGGTWD